MKVTRYTPDQCEQWNDFIRRSKNGTFLFDRAYMDYHAHRFEDHSLLFYDERMVLRAVLPANRAGERLVSHGGLTYGGVVSDATMTTPLMIEIFDALHNHCAANGVTKVIYKTVPSIYAQIPAQEDLYTLFVNDARLVRRDVLSVLSPARHPPFQERRLRKIKQARKAGLEIVESREYGAFWPLLEQNLRQRHDTNPAHGLAEIELLSFRFPDKIRLHMTIGDGVRVLAGAVVYDTAVVAHVQYISVSDEGRLCGALDLLFADLIENVYKLKLLFDFGISTEFDGRFLNRGLIEQKEGFGARAMIHDSYEMTVR
jgi:Acetyltransferase (GNAT) domain